MDKNTCSTIKLSAQRSAQMGLTMQRYDCIIIGGGVIGASVARELSAYCVNTLVLEREEDVCAGTSKANSGLVHAGFDAKPGTRKAAMNVEGNRRMEQVCRELDVAYKKTGALVLAFEKEEIRTLEHLQEQGKKNGVAGLSILDAGKAYELEPNLAEGIGAALYAESAGIVCPFELTIGMAENASVNGVSFAFLSEVLEICRKEDGAGAYYELVVENQSMFTQEKPRTVRYEAACIVNCAGVYADMLHNMVSSRKRHITPRRGEYCLLDKEAGTHVSRTIFKVPGAFGKGILVTPTVHGNLLLGPTAQDIGDKEGICTTAAGLEQVLGKTAETVQGIPAKKVITSFAGLRAHEDDDDFVLGEAEGAPGFLDALGIESPGLTSAPAVGVYLAKMAAEYLGAEKKADFIPYRKGIVHFAQLPVQQQKKLIAVRPEYGSVICRCETITEGEILDAIYRPLGARSLDGIKRRTRAGMGRCQSGFCSPRVVELLAQACQVPQFAISKAGPGSRLLTSYNKEVE